MSQVPSTNSPKSPNEPGLDAAQQSLSDALRVSFGVLKVLMAVLFVVYILSGIFSVDESQTAVRYRLGEQIGTYGPGWHFGLPFPIEQVVRVPRTTQTVRIDKAFWYDNPDNKKPEELGFQALDPLKDSFLITGDTNVVHVQFGVNYVIREADVDRYLRNVGSLERADELVRLAAEQGMIHYVASETVDNLIIRSKFLVETIAANIQAVLTDLDSGITVQQVLIDNNNQSMPNQVRQAYVSVTQAQADKVKTIQEARRSYDETLGRTAGGAHNELLTMVRAYEAALGSGQDDLAAALREELDRSIRELRLPEPAVIQQISAYRQAMTNATQADDADTRAGAQQAAEALKLALASQPAERTVSQRPIAGEIASAISRAKARRFEISTQAEQDYKRYASALDAYRKTPLVLANDRLQAVREKVMTGLTLNVVGDITRLNTTPDPRDVEDINNAEFERQRQEAAAKKAAEESQ